MDVVVAPGVEALAEDPPVEIASRGRPSLARDLLGQAVPPVHPSSRRMLASFDRHRRFSEATLIQRGSGPKQISVMSSTWLWPAENSRMSCKSARPTASGPPVVSASFFMHPALVARFVELFAEVARVSHAVGEDGDDVAGIEADLGLLVIAVGNDSQGKPGDFLADLVDRAVAAADHDGKVARRSDRQGALLGVEDGEAQGDELLFDGRREEQAC